MATLARQAATRLIINGRVALVVQLAPVPHVSWSGGFRVGVAKGSKGIHAGPQQGRCTDARLPGRCHCPSFFRGDEIVEFPLDPKCVEQVREAHRYSSSPVSNGSRCPPSEHGSHMSPAQSPLACIAGARAVLTIFVEHAACGHEGESSRRADVEEIEAVHARILLSIEMGYG